MSDRVDTLPTREQHAAMDAALEKAVAAVAALAEAMDGAAPREPMLAVALAAEMLEQTRAEMDLLCAWQSSSSPDKGANPPTSSICHSDSRVESLAEALIEAMEGLFLDGKRPPFVVPCAIDGDLWLRATAADATEARVLIHRAVWRAAEWPKAGQRPAPPRATNLPRLP